MCEYHAIEIPFEDTINHCARLRAVPSQQSSERPWHRGRAKNAVDRESDFGERRVRADHVNDEIGEEQGAARGMEKYHLVKWREAAKHELFELSAPAERGVAGERRGEFQIG